MSTFSIKIDKNTKKEIIPLRSLQVISQPGNVFFVADDKTNSFKKNGVFVLENSTAKWNELQEVRVDLKSGDKVEFCISNRDNQKVTNDNPAMFVATIYYEINKSVSTDSSWTVNDKASKVVGSVVWSTNDGWNGINYGPISKLAKNIWSQDDSIDTCFTKELP